MRVALILTAATVLFLGCGQSKTESSFTKADADIVEVKPETDNSHVERANHAVQQHRERELEVENILTEY